MSNPLPFKKLVPWSAHLPFPTLQLTEVHLFLSNPSFFFLIARTHDICFQPSGEPVPGEKANPQDKEGRVDPSAICNSIRRLNLLSLLKLSSFCYFITFMPCLSSTVGKLHIRRISQSVSYPGTDHTQTCSASMWLLALLRMRQEKMTLWNVARHISHGGCRVGIAFSGRSLLLSAPSQGIFDKHAVWLFLMSVSGGRPLVEPNPILWGSVGVTTALLPMSYGA